MLTGGEFFRIQVNFFFSAFLFFSPQTGFVCWFVYPFFSPVTIMSIYFLNKKS